MMKQSFFTALMMLGGSLASQAQNTDSIPLGEVIIQESRTPIKFSESLRSITIITAKDIAAMPAVSVQEILSYTAGLDVRQRGAGGAQADISLRGGNFDQCLILIDGVKFSDPQTGHHLLNIPILPADIERIEILRGSASRIFGQNGFSGAINIITKKDFNKRVYTELSGGSFTSLAGNVALSNQNKHGWGNRLSVGYNTNAGYESNRDLKQFQGLYQSALPLTSSSQVRLSAGFQQKAFGAQYFYTPPAAKYREYEETQAAFGTLTGQFTKLANLTVNLNWRRHADEFRLWRDSLHRGINKHVTSVYSMDANSYVNWKYGTSSFGVDLRNEQIQSSALDTHDRSIFAVFIEHRLPKHKIFSAVIGTNISYISGYGWIAYPGADLGIRINALLRFNMSVGRSYRVPTFTDLYYTDAGPSSLGNPNLAPEEAWTYEGGIVAQSERMRGSVTYFLRDASTLIDWQKENPSDLTWMAINVMGTTTSGLETDFVYSFQNKVLKQIRIAHTWLHSNKIATNQVSRYVYDYLTHQITASTQLQYTKKISQSFYYRFLERASYPSAHVLDTRLNYQTPQWQAWIQWENVTQTQYYQLRNVLMPNTWVRLGFSVNL